MSRNHNHLRNFTQEPPASPDSRDTAALRRYLQKQVSADDVVKLLKNGKQNKFLAAEICLQEATYSTTPDRKEKWLNQAQRGFEYLASDTRDVMYSEKAKSLLQLAQFEIYRALIVDGKLPDNNIAQKVYYKTLQVSHEVVKQRWNTPGQSEKSKIEMSGDVAETSILLLGQRFAINAGITDSWFPVFSFVGEDNMKLKEPSYTNRGWDISFYTHNADELEMSYKLQVKSTRGFCEQYANDVTIVCLSPDLRINAKEYISSSLIAEECYSEEVLGSKLYTHRLNVRTEKFLDQLG